MSTCKHGLEFLDSDECCGLCAGEEINTLKAQIAQLKTLFELQHAATDAILNGLGDVVPIKRGFSQDDFATLRRALHHTVHCQDTLPASQCNCGCREALDLLNQKENP